MATKAKKAARKKAADYFVLLSIRRDVFAKLSADKQVTLFGLASETNSPHAVVVELQFKRPQWFHVCGEVYALLIANVPFTLECVRITNVKGGAK